MLEIIPVPIFNDNYVWLIVIDNSVWVVDPGAHEPVVETIVDRGLTLKGVLITHHHWDHIEGVNPLIAHLGGKDIPVFGPQHPNFSVVTHPVYEASQISLGPVKATVMKTPGHTADHISYWIESERALFSGDTLFSCGCGRLFDGTAEQLFESLSRIKKLPNNTQIFATHEYTLANIRFAKAVEPHNQDLLNYEIQCHALRKTNTPTLPTTLLNELRINPFLRTHLPAVQNSIETMLGRPCEEEKRIFSELRRWKNHY